MALYFFDCAWPERHYLWLPDLESAMGLYERNCVQAIARWAVKRFNLLEIAPTKMFLLYVRLSVSSCIGKVFCSLV
jgi:hypothetical protein